MSVLCLDMWRVDVCTHVRTLQHTIRMCVCDRPLRIRRYNSHFRTLSCLACLCSQCVSTCDACLCLHSHDACLCLHSVYMRSIFVLCLHLKHVCARTLVLYGCTRICRIWVICFCKQTASMCWRMHAHMRIFLCVYMYLCSRVCLYVCMHIYIYLSIYLSIYLY